MYKKFLDFITVTDFIRFRGLWGLFLERNITGKFYSKFLNSNLSPNFSNTAQGDSIIKYFSIAHTFLPIKSFINLKLFYLTLDIYILLFNE